MKKIVSFLLAITTILLTGSLIACNGSNRETDDTVTTHSTENNNITNQLTETTNKENDSQETEDDNKIKAERIQRTFAL